MLGDIVVLGCGESEVAQVCGVLDHVGALGFSEEAGSREGAW